jgi:hypothetical protein
MNPQQQRLLSDSIAQGNPMYTSPALIPKPVEFDPQFTSCEREED